jgi:hypothetical protein
MGFGIGDALSLGAQGIGNALKSGVIDPISNFGSGVRDTWRSITGVGGLKNAEEANDIAAYNSAWQRIASEENLQFQKDTFSKNFGLAVDAFEWQKNKQEEAWAREDNAVQRRVEDLKAAGINPLLAAGSSASSSAPIKVAAPQAQAPQKNVSGVASAQAAAVQSKMAQARAQFEMATMAQNIASTAMDMAYKKQQLRKADVEARFLEDTFGQRAAYEMHRESMAVTRQHMLADEYAENPRRLRDERHLRQARIAEIQARTGVTRLQAERLIKSNELLRRYGDINAILKAGGMLGSDLLKLGLMF